jgi:AcrR family transcriptional regulator
VGTSVSGTRAKLLEAAAQAVCEDGVAAASARAIADRAQVNQALVFYHFGTVSELLEAASRRRVDDSVAYYRERFASVRTLSELLVVGRDLHERERDVGNVALMAQLMSGGQHDPVLARAARYAMTTWTAEVEAVVARVLAGSPLVDVTNLAGLSRVITAGFIGLELVEGVDPDAAASTLDALGRLAVLVEVVNDLGAVGRSAMRAKMRTRRRPVQG